MSCEICGHVFAQQHRIVPGAWGGSYESDNVALLCPNHHAAVHFLMRSRHRGVAFLNDEEMERLYEYGSDLDLMAFWDERAQPVVISRMSEEGRWGDGVRPMALVVTEVYPPRCRPEQ